MRTSLLALLLLAATAPAHADPHPMSSGAAPAPIDDTQVAMTEENLTITMHERWADVVAAVTLENRGPATGLTVGFPCASGPVQGDLDVPCKVPLTITLDGKKVKAKKRKTSPELGHWLWPMKFAAGQKVALVVSYRAPLLNDRYSSPIAGMGAFTYRLTTGARWAGPIGKLTITVDYLQDALLYVSPPGYQREPGRLTWTLTDYEPTAEVVLIPHPYTGASIASRLGAFDKKARGKRTPTEHLRARLADGDYARADIEATLKRLADGGAEPEWLRIITRVAKLPTPDEQAVQACVAESVAQLTDLAKRAKR